MFDLKNNKKILIFISAFILIIFLLSRVSLMAEEDPDKNKIRVNSAKITNIETGSPSSISDGIDYSDNSSNTLDTSFNPGYDNSPNNRIVRSFDTIKYHISFSIEGKDGNTYENRNVVIKTVLTSEESMYVDSDSISDVIIENISTYGGIYEAEVDLKVLGAPNEFKIEPKFIVKEQTDEDEPIILGKNDTGYNYSYSNGAYNNTSEFMNYMPTVVSSVPSFNIYVRSSNDNPLAKYNNANGRYMNYVIGLELIGIGDGIKGISYPTEDITFDLNIDNNSITDASWLRVYDNEKNVDGIVPAILPSPYGNKVNSDNSVYSNDSGTISMTGENGSYKVTISNYKISTLKFPSINADGSAIDASKGVFGSYALTLFSKREIGNMEPITSSVSISNVNVQNNNEIQNDNNASAINEYYDSSDYSMTSGFIKSVNDETPISKDGNGKGSISKGDTVAYKTTFSHSSLNSNSGFKQIIKLDPIAFRVLSASDTNDILIDVECKNDKCDKISKDDFEIKFISGNYDSENYTLNTDFSKIADEDKNIVSNKCSSLVLNDYNSDQIMNLYGGPCIVANPKTETTYNNIKDAKTKDNKEVPITKMIVQTKKGIKLPSNVQIKIIANLRVRDIPDITQTYQVTTMTMTSDYDSELKYYVPGVLDNENSVTSPNNYRKSIYNYNSLVSTSSNLWGDSLKIVNYVARNTISVLNTNKDGSAKNTFNIKENETIKYKIITNIEDMNEQVGADDVWWINSLNVTVNIPKELDYIEDKKLGTPQVLHNEDGSTTLIYTLPYTKPNMDIDEIRFNAKLKPNIKGSKNKVEVTSTVNAININNEVDTSIIGSTSSKYEIYVTGEENVISMQKVGNMGTVVEKGKTFEYLLSAYNNTNEDVTNYSIFDILPYNQDKNESVIDGTYEVKITLPDEQSAAKVYCTTKESNTLTNEVEANNNDFKECDLTDYKNITGFKITGLQIKNNEYMNDIKLSIKPKDNKYSNTYNNSFYGKANDYNQTESNKIEIGVISRSISGRVFIDNNLDGVQNDGNYYVKDIPVTLYKINNDGVKEVTNTVTNENGEYKFSDLDTGRYKIRLKYDNLKYDLALRYAIENQAIDSDAYKISDKGEAEISSKVTPDKEDGIILSNTNEKVTNMDMGLIPRTTFGFDMKKYITRIELNANNTLSTYNYDNVSTASISVKNSANATAKIYYGISITNTSTTEGYIRLVEEDIPSGLYFDKNDSYNKDWFELDGALYSEKYKNDLIKPGETRYLQIALNMPRREKAGTFLNTVSIVEMQPLDKSIAEEAEFDTYDDYKIGDEVNYAGMKWNVIKNENSYLTLLASTDAIEDTMSHGNNPYRWSTSNINKFINNEWQNLNSLNLPILQDNLICDDASGLESASYGGTLKEENKCISGIYNRYKVRLLTEKEYSDLINDNSFSEKSFLNDNFAIMNSSYINPQYGTYGNQTNSISNMVKAVNGTSIIEVNTSTKLKVRPVITVSSDNVIIE